MKIKLARNHLFIGLILFVSGAMGLHIALYDNSIELPETKNKPDLERLVAPNYPDPKINLDEYLGKVVVLNFWATWCPSCDQEMPSIQALHQHFDKEDLVVVTVSIDNNQETVDTYMMENQFDFPVIFDPNNTLGKKMGVTAYPETHIINKSGITIQKVLGAREWDSPNYLDTFEQLIGAQTIDG